MFEIAGALIIGVLIGFYIGAVCVYGGDVDER